MYSRREFGQLALASSAAALFLKAEAESKVGGVRLGTITYSFHDMPNVVGQNHVDAVIADCKQCGVELIELLSSHVEPVTEYQVRRTEPTGLGAGGPQGGAAAPGGAPAAGRARGPEAQKAREELRAWRLATPMSYFKEVRKKLNDAGITVFAYTINSIGVNFTDDEMDKVFEQAKTLGATAVSSSTTVEAAQKVVPFAEKHQFPVAFHNHQDITDPNQVATPESFYKVLAMSKFYRMNLDIGYITGSNVDAVAFIKQNHERITHLHMKDRQKNLGDSVAWGHGDTPIKEVLTLLKTQRYPIPALVELSYPVPADSNCVKEVAKCMEYMKRLLA